MLHWMDTKRHTMNRNKKQKEKRKQEQHTIRPQVKSWREKKNGEENSPKNKIANAQGKFCYDAFGLALFNSIETLSVENADQIECA